MLGIAAVMLLYFLVARRVTKRVRQSLHEFEALAHNSIDADSYRVLDDNLQFEVPPMRIHLERATAEIWAGERGVDECSRWITNNGFAFDGDYLIEELPDARLKVFLSDDEELVATIRQDDLENAPYVEFCFDLGGQSRGGVSNPPHSTVPLPEGAIGETLPRRLLRRRPHLTQNVAASSGTCE